MKSKVALLIILVFAILQLFRGENRPYQDPTENDLFAVEKAPEGIELYMKNNCYDCHSNQVNHPWYSEIAPVSWWVQDHVEEGSEHLNFSEWGKYSAKKKAHKMEEAVEEVEEEEMPLLSYTLIHREAILESDEKEALLAWFKSIETKYAQ
ncbi:MAG: heme-binding domain-containing protein [Vicingaceae bacterium]